MRCGYQCHEVGGPWIAENPDCPIHNHEAVAERERAETEQYALLQRIEKLEQPVAALQGLANQNIRYK